jgi:hypothetical protein
MPMLTKDEMRNWGKWQMIFGAAFLLFITTMAFISDLKPFFTLLMVLFSSVYAWQGYLVFKKNSNHSKTEE